MRVCIAYTSHHIHKLRSNDDDLTLLVDHPLLFGPFVSSQYNCMAV